MDCGSCTELIPDDSIFCPECGARQEMSRAGGFTNPGSIGLSGQEVSGGRNFGVVSGEAVRQQRDMTMGGNTNISPEILQQIAMGIQQQPNIPPGQFPPQNLPPQQQGQFPPPNFPPSQMGNIPPQGMPQQQPPQHLPQQPPQQGNVLPNVQSDRPQQARGPSLASGAVPQNPVSNISAYTPGGTVVASNPATSPTDAMVNRLAEAERAMKDERRSQWLNMNQTPANNVLASLGTELPSHLRGIDTNPPPSDAPNEALLRRMCEVAVRRVARKRGVAVETPQAKLEEGTLKVNVTYVDDGRVLDTPEALTQAFQHAIQTEVALKGFDLMTELKLSRSKDGEVENLNEADSEEDDVEMFACEICDGLVKETDNECPHCGAMFEEEEEEEEEVVEVPKRSAPKRSGPPGPSKGGPPKKSGPPGPSKGGPPKKSGPPGPSKGGPPKKSGPPGPSKDAPPKKSGPPGPSKGGPPKKSGPPGPSKGGPPGPSKDAPPKKSGPPGPSKGGPPKKSGPSGPSKGGPPRGGPSGPKRGPPR